LARAQSTDRDNPPRNNVPAPTTSPQNRSSDADNVRRRLLNGMPTDQDIAAAEEFLKTNSPNRYKAYQKLMASGGKHPFIQRGIVHGYLQVQLLKDQDPELYKMKIDELGLEDEMFGIVSDARKGGQPIDRESLRKQLRPVDHALIEKRKEEFQHRIQKMQQAVDNEKLHLDKLQTADAAAIENRIDQEIDSVGRLPGIAGGGGPGGRPFQPPPDGNPTTHSVDADQIPLNK
jgi:hypothetical protein